MPFVSYLLQSTVQQVAELMRAAEPMGLDFMKVFTEMMSEAVAKRQVLTDCIDYCGTHEADFLLVSEISRLGRSLKIIIDTLDKLMSAGVDVFIKNSVSIS